METFKTLHVILLALAMVGAFTACKKNSEKKKSCKIVDAAINGAGDIHISYNGDGRISQAAVGVGSVYTFTYSGDSVIVLNTDSGAFVSKTTYANNSAGLTTYARTEYDQAGANWSIGNYEYDGEELSKATITTSAGGSPDVNTYTWFDHNMVAQTAGPTTTVYDYYADKPEQSGDYFSFFQAIQGGETIRNKNLVKSATGIAFNYAFDADGNISSLELAGTSSVAVLSYTYQCN